MLVLFGMAASAMAALVTGIYLSVSTGGSTSGAFSNEPSDWTSAPGER
jgi:hypothetical protein